MGAHPMKRFHHRRDHLDRVHRLGTETIQRTANPWGHPDLQGTWTTDDARSVPLQRAAEFGDRRFLTDQDTPIANGATMNARRRPGGGGTFVGEVGLARIARPRW